MQKPSPSFWRRLAQRPARYVRDLVVVGLLAAVLSAVVLTPSCASTPQGLQREQTIYRYATNAVAAVQTIAPNLPAPANTAVELVLAVAAAGLAAWNAHQQRAITKLKKGNGKPSTTPTPDASASSSRA
jgi:hypothetical protein